MQGVSLSAYTLLHLLPQAQKDVEDREKLVLTDRDRDLFLSTIAGTPKLMGKLKTAIAEYRVKHEASTHPTNRVLGEVTRYNFDWQPVKVK